MSRLRRFVAAALLAGPLAGCGIPDHTPVVPEGPGPSTGLAAGSEVTPSQDPRGATTDRAQFVANYLDAAAGDPDTAVERVRDFLSPAMRPTFKPTQDVRVVRLTERPLVNPGSAVVRLRVQQVGVLERDGTLTPTVADTAVTEYQLAVEEVPGETGLFLTRAPQQLLLSESALGTFYQRRTIYFWNRDKSGLVPDLRYLPITVPSERQPTQILEWLTTGPADWLAGTVDPLPKGTSSIGNVPAVNDDKLQINLGAALPSDDPKVLDRLRRQLMWSLRPNLPAVLELKIDRQVVGDYRSNDYLTSNPAYRFGDEPVRFCVYNGQVRRLVRSADPAQPIPVLTPEVNRGVLSAAMANSGARTYVALVVGAAARPVLRVGAAATGQTATFSRAKLPAPAGNPVWAVNPDGGEAGTALGLIVAGGRLYSFAADAARPRRVEWPGGPAKVSAVSVAPDGHRVAVVSAGQVYVTVLTATGSGMQLGPPRPVATEMRDVTAVDWSSEGSLVVAGTRADSGRVAIRDVSIDGTSQTDRLADLGTAKVTHLVAYPANPASGAEDSDSVAYVADKVAYDALSTPERIAAADVTGPAADPGVTPTAPFFLN